MDLNGLQGWRGALLGLALVLAGCERGSSVASSAAGAEGSAVASTGAPPKRSNIVLIVIDTMRADALLDPDGRYHTPSLDRLAKDGIVFTRAFAHAPMTLPSHASLFSSRPPLETRVLNNGQEVPADLPLLAEWMAQHGYATRAVISLGTLNPGAKPGVSRGFGDFDARFWCISRAEDTAVRLRESLAQRDAAEPFFLFAHYADPHEPYNAHGSEQRSARMTLDGQPLEDVVTSEMSLLSRPIELAPGRHVFELRSPERFRVRRFEVWEGGRELETVWEQAKPLDRTRLARVAVERQGESTGSCLLKMWISDVPADTNKPLRYALEVSYADRYVGELLAELEELGLYRDSIVLFTSDHGESLGEPLRNGETPGQRFFGHVDGLTDEQIHVPLILKLPEGDPRAQALARSADRIVPQIDLAPTLLELVGLPPLPGQRGTSLLAPHESIHFAETHQPEAKKNQLCLRDERFKLIYLVDEERFLMYDLERDPGELEDVFAARGRERADWPERLHALARSLAARAQGAEAIDEATRRELEALGYGGGG